MKIAIVGGGNLGLGVLYSLTKERRHNVTLFERSARLGGIADTFPVEWDGREYQFPVSYRHFNLSPFNQRLVKILGLEDQLIEKVLPHVIVRGKYKLAYDFWDIRASLREWFRRSDIPWDVRLAVLPPILQNFRFYKSVPLGGFKNGHCDFLRAFEKEIIRRGVEVKKEADVSRIDFDGNEVEYTHQGGRRTDKFEMIISTIPPQAVVPLASGLPDSMVREIKGIRYPNSISLCLGVRGKMDAAYMTHVHDKSYSFYEVSNFTHLHGIDDEKTVLYVVGLGPHLDGLEDQELIRTFEKDLERIFPGVGPKIEWRKLIRHPTSRPAPLLRAIPFLGDKAFLHKGNHILMFDFRSQYGSLSFFDRFLRNLYHETLDRSSVTSYGLMLAFGVRYGEMLAKNAVDGARESS